MSEDITFCDDSDETNLIKQVKEKRHIAPYLLYTTKTKVIDEQPTDDAVQVVMCKDCRYADDYYHDGSIYCCIPNKPIEWHDDDPNWFCADGERKEGEHE